MNLSSLFNIKFDEDNTSISLKSLFDYKDDNDKNDDKLDDKTLTREFNINKLNSKKIYKQLYSSYIKKIKQENKNGLTELCITIPIMYLSDLNSMNVNSINLNYNYTDCCNYIIKKLLKNNIKVIQNDKTFILSWRHQIVNK